MRGKIALVIQAVVVSQEELSPGYFLLELEAPEVARKAKAGQFVRIKAWEGWDPLLPRPFSIHQIQESRLWILYQRRGLGTELLGRARQGDKVLVDGPLGRPFPLPKRGPVWLVAGGLGLAPFFFYAETLQAHHIPFQLFYGARSKADLLRLDRLKNLEKLDIATEDGSLGHRGFVTDLIKAGLKKERPEVIIACGPAGMLSAVGRIGEARSVPTYLSLEAFMACGRGLCLGCAVKGRQEGYLKVCVEGPAVDSREVDLEALG